MAEVRQDRASPRTWAVDEAAGSQVWLYAQKLSKSQDTRTGLFGKKQTTPAPADLSAPEQGSEDFELIGLDEVSIHPEEEFSCHKGAYSDTTGGPGDHPTVSHPAPVASTCTKSSLFKFKNFSKASLHLSVATDRASSCPTGTTTEESDLYLAFPQPPTHIPTPVTSTYCASSFRLSTQSYPHPRGVETTSSATESNLFASDSEFNGGRTVSSPPTSEYTPDSVPLANPLVTVLPCPENPARPRHRLAESLRRFKSFSQILRESFISHSGEDTPTDTATIKEGDPHDSEFHSGSLPADPAFSAASSAPNPPSNVTYSSSESSAVDTSESNFSPTTPVFIQLSPSPTVQVIPAPPRLRRRSSAPAARGHVAKYELVNPSQLTSSPSPLVDSLLIHSTRSSFILPSPSWLSRNVQHIDLSETETEVTTPPSGISALSESEHLRVPGSAKFFPSALFAPDSPRPLPIPPPVIPVPPPQPRSFQPSPYRPSLQRLVTEIHPASPETDADSFVTSPTPAESTLYSPESSITPTTVFATALPSPSQVPHRRLSSINRVNVERQRNTIARAKKNRLNSPRTRLRSSLTPCRPSLNPAFKDISRKSPCGGAKLHLVKAPSPSIHDNSSDDRTIFFPPRRATDVVKPSPLPKDLACLLEAFFIQSGIIDSLARPTMDYTAKNLDVVDFGGEVDYAGYQWFQEPPPRPEPQPAAQPYVPDEEVIKQNQAFDFALKAAPNVLYGRFKHFQLGVLAWCSEFSEMIDSLKELGFSGNMFVATRTQALKTCEDILKLRLDIKMQIILMYLSSQVSRLRRFLDSGERQWDDYPVPEFPLDYRAYSS
ncbi:hypothetical protein ID866_5451 [Astraeus odoratus]|nr:hypothetical protein ID866_5451 [Astraeus odoratus]